jgi:hypothetical protein
MTEYKDREFWILLKKSIDFINIKSAFCCSIIFGLEAVKFLDRKAKNTMTKKGSTFLILLIPLFLQFFTITYFNYIDKKSMISSLAQDCLLLLIEGKLTNEGVIPFWFFNLRY